MVKVLKNGISWFLDEHEGLASAVEGVVEEENVRRSYAVRDFGGRKVFVKFFLERGLWGFLRNRVRPRGKREYELGKRILACGVATPMPMGYGVGRSGSFIVQEQLEGETLRSAFAQAAERAGLLDSLALLLRQLALAGIRHNDLHLENVLVSAGRLSLIDLHKARLRPDRFDRTDEVKNLCQALTMIYNELTEQELERFFDRYGRPDARPAVEEGLREQWTRWIGSKKKRSFSTTSKLLAKGRRVYVRGREEAGRGPLVEIIKNDRKVRVERRGDHIRKIYRGRRRLARAWENWAALEYVTLDVAPRPFFVERPALFRDGYVAMEDLSPFGEELDRFLDRTYDAMDLKSRRAFIDRLSRFLGGLLRMGIVQRDLKGCNVFVLAGGFRLLDVEDIGFFAPGEEDLARMMTQLCTSVPSRIGTADRIRFFLKVTRSAGLGGKALFRRTVEACGSREIVYEGVSGLKKESWQGRPQDFPASFRRPTR